MERRRSALRIVPWVVLCASSGCGSLTPRNFRAMKNPAPVVRAGAVGRADNQPDGVAIPAWIARLDDKDSVVRMAANEGLKKRTGQDFGFVPWDEPGERASAVARWKAWWQARRQTPGSDARQDGLVTKARYR